MHRSHQSKFMILGVLGALLLILAACPSGEPGQVEAAAQTEPGERTIYVQATELDARRAIDRDAFPQATREQFPQYFGPPDDPFASEGAPGYYMFMTSEDEWRIGSYLFVPQEVIAYQGERITLEVLGVRGGHHGNILLGPDGEVVQGPNGDDVRFDVNRGELQVIEFIAEQPGLYQLICVDHAPTMVMNFHVLPR